MSDLLGKKRKKLCTINTAKFKCFIHEHIWLAANFPASHSRLNFVFSEARQHMDEPIELYKHVENPVCVKTRAP